ncbi:hypothetical protein ACFL27_05235 [candidate division CSSED10-310 bacterium]|uniref:Uncharacterized protein n=1 Tax=candidate division CSSED10-310 bacterium TaxID=2855610 RepID=A0ABV6YTQ7_UNCC1
MLKNKLALRPYLEAIEKYCNQLSKNEMTETIINLAKEIPVGEREGFLNILHSFSPTKKAIPDEENVRDKIFDQIEGLKEDMQERIDSIEDGTYWDTVDYEDGYYDDDPDYISEDQVDDLLSLFETAERYFIDDRLELARDIYKQLFNFFHEFSELKYCMPSSTDTFDVKESRARYCRCVYETSDKKDLVDNMIEAMDLNASISDRTLILEKEYYPMLQDVMDAKTGNLKDWDDFLEKWNAVLKIQKSNRADTLQLEVALLLKGIDGVAELARKWGQNQPRGYIFWIQNLLTVGDWIASSEVCLEALNILPYNAFREQAARYLIQAGNNVEEKALILTGKREKFKSSPDETNLLDLAVEADSQNVRKNELSTLLDEYKKLIVSPLREDTLYTKFLLMTGEVKTAFDDAKKAKSVGWSYGKAGLVFGSVLYLVCGKSDEAKTIKNLLKSYANARSGYSWGTIQDVSSTMYDEILKGLIQYKISSADQGTFLSWAHKIGAERIDHIVSNKHRKAYGRAAAVLGALSECYILLGQKSNAQNLLNEFYFDKYKRYPAFRREVKSIFKSSGNLASLLM